MLCGCNNVLFIPKNEISCLIVNYMMILMSINIKRTLLRIKTFYELKVRIIKYFLECHRQDCQGSCNDKMTFIPYICLISQDPWNFGYFPLDATTCTGVIFCTVTWGDFAQLLHKFFFSFWQKNYWSQILFRFFFYEFPIYSNISTVIVKCSRWTRI
jgi:hypothetical protein